MRFIYDGVWSVSNLPRGRKSSRNAQKMGWFLFERPWRENGRNRPSKFTNAYQNGAFKGSHAETNREKSFAIVLFWFFIRSEKNSHLTLWFSNLIRILLFFILGSFSFRLFFSQGSDSVAVFEDIDKRFFATDRKMNKLELGRDGFFNFDLWLKIFSDMQIL